uniref:Uncharacterized protein n=1 Tax=Globodera rostochiensis TaxID=31243 RepID=A0A914I691_GLORO
MVRPVDFRAMRNWMDGLMEQMNGGGGGEHAPPLKSTPSSHSLVGLSSTTTASPCTKIHSRYCSLWLPTLPFPPLHIHSLSSSTATTISFEGTGKGETMNDDDDDDNEHNPASSPFSSQISTPLLIYRTVFARPSSINTSLDSDSADMKSDESSAGSGCGASVDEFCAVVVAPPALIDLQQKAQRLLFARHAIQQHPICMRISFVLLCHYFRVIPEPRHADPGGDQAAPKGRGNQHWSSRRY